MKKQQILITRPLKNWCFQSSNVLKVGNPIRYFHYVTLFRTLTIIHYVFQVLTLNTHSRKSAIILTRVCNFCIWVVTSFLVPQRYFFFLISPKGRVPRALPVGECKGGDMVCLGHGSPSIRPRSLSNGISRCLDSEISPPYPESWCAGLFEKTFPESDEKFAWV